MASPFKVFRKHQKAWLVGLTILAMFSFVFLGVISDLMGNRSPQNPVVVKTSKYGKLTQRDLAFMRQERLVVLQVLSRIHAAALGINPESSRKMLENLFGTVSDEDLVYTWLKAQRADEIGMVISDQFINDFLQKVSSGKLAARDISAIIAQEKISDYQFFNMLREELRALEVTQIFSISMSGITPAQRWDYFCQLRRQASVELIPVDVEQFIARVQPPSDEELKTLFEQYKNKLLNPVSPEPGFRIPHKIDVQYFKADITKFSDPSTITDEEIQSTYEKYREQFDKIDKESSSALKPEEKGAAEKEKSPEMEKKDTTAPGEQSTEQPKEQPKEQPAEEQKPADQPAPQEKSSGEDAKKSSAVERSPFSLTAMAEQSDIPAAEKSAAAEPKAEKPAATEPKDEKPAAAEPKAEKPAAAEPKDEKPATAEPKDEKPAATQPEKAEASKPGLSEKMKERVRRQVAGEKIKAIFLQLQQTMDENGRKWRKYEAEKIQQTKASPPPSLDFEALAKQYGLTAGRTGLISNWEAQKFDVGSSMVVDGFIYFPDVAFKSLTTFKPVVSVDLKGNEYLFWKINDTPETAPSLDDKDVRQQVIRAWKLIQARQMARKEAERLAEAAAKTGATLKGAFPDLPNIQVISPPPFTMLTEGNVPRGSSPVPPRYSEVEGAPMAGRDFMRAVFNLDVNQFGVAVNAPQTVVYVVQLLSYSPPQETLWQIFLAEDFSKYVVAAQDDLRADHRAWLESLKTSAGLQWEIKPQAQRGESSPDSLPEEE